ncbi:hypothetical protein FA13DRAFT_207452 [Coprinellus micaceus]|uniref:Uncharacterized protein n=1 Tax=Coprinellus micaceus TaxID=71717 RepID=A0A4Y7SHA4_COPMI|nr:hypothetical protein FA13DRAFT_207452 [Coprinellus micaceus]
MSDPQDLQQAPTSLAMSHVQDEKRPQSRRGGECNRTKGKGWKTFRTQWASSRTVGAGSNGRSYGGSASSLNIKEEKQRLCVTASTGKCPGAESLQIHAVETPNESLGSIDESPADESLTYKAESSESRDPALGLYARPTPSLVSPRKRMLDKETPDIGIPKRYGDRRRPDPKPSRISGTARRWGEEGRKDGTSPRERERAGTGKSRNGGGGREERGV